MKTKQIPHLVFYKQAEISTSALRSSNNTETNQDLRPGRQIFIKTFTTDKMKSVWSGPYEIIEVCEHANWVRIEGLGMIKKVSVKNIRMRGENVML